MGDLLGHDPVRADSRAMAQRQPSGHRGVTAHLSTDDIKESPYIMATNKQDRVIIFDTTLRDGEQSPGCSMNLREKIEVARQLARLGVDVIEAGFPISSPGDFEAVRSVAEQIGSIPDSPVICGLARAREQDIDRCWEAVKHAANPRIHTFLATSPIHMEFKLRMEPAQVLETIVERVKQAASYTKDVEFSLEDSGRTDWGFMVEVVTAAIEAGATTINIPDTVGYCQPDQYASQFAT
jgi:2-isopropylmalate synthase